MIGLTPAVKGSRCPSRQIQARATPKSKIYIGKGRYVDDDLSKYPTKTNLTGGWAGGEAGLQQFVEEIKTGKAGKVVSQGPATKLLGGKDVIYTGKGNYVRDDAQKYPSKTNMTGGFAGGEKGVAKFVADGELKFEEDFRPQSSPLIVGLAMSGIAIVISSVWFAVGN